MRLEHSRATRLGARASGLEENALERRLNETTVLISGDPRIPGVPLTMRVLVETLRRQPLQLTLDPQGLDEQLVDDLQHRAAAIDPTRPLGIQSRDGDEGLRIALGGDERAQLRVLPDGYGAHLARTGPLTQARPATALGSVFAAALAAAEIFKEAANVLPSRKRHHERLSFCPVALSDDLELAPDLQPQALDAALVGLGAVGSASALILGQLPLHGRLLLVDPEPFAGENLGTYSLGTSADAKGGVAKVELAARALTNFETIAVQTRIEDVVRQIDAKRLPWPRVVLSGLDSVAARHATQLLWPEILIDAATGDTSLGVHEARDGEACLMCFFPQRGEGPSALTRLAEATRLSPELLRKGNHVLSEEDLDALDEEHRSLLEPHLGIAVCGLAKAIGLTEEGDDSYLPSVPFVSQQAACLGVGRLVACLLGLSDLPNLVQYDALLGPEPLTELKQPPRPDCYSVLNRTVIEAVQKERRNALSK